MNYRGSSVCKEDFGTNCRNAFPQSGHRMGHKRDGSIRDELGVKTGKFSEVTDRTRGKNA
jgi:hypothetical protein